MSSKVIPPNIIILYAWEILQLNTSLARINDLVPIIAVEDEPQIADAQQTYLVYGYSENNDPRMVEIRRGIVAFNIKARHFGEVGQITNALTRAFENKDISAAQINAWKATYPNNIFRNIRFTQTETLYIEGGLPEDTEGGPLHGLVNIAYEVIVSDPTFALPTASQHTLWA